MDLVVRTPHGDADVRVVSAPADATLADLVGAITGQAAPSVVHVDGRPTATSQKLGDLALRVGTVLDSHPRDRSATTVAAVTSDEPFADARDEVDGIRLRQLTGRGAGTVRPLLPGRYRIGPGRRLNAEEMAEAPVDSTGFEIVVGDGFDVTVTPDPRAGGPHGALTPTLDDQLFDRELAWTTGLLSVGGRAFTIEDDDPDEIAAPHLSTAPDAAGTIAFERSASRGVAVQRPPAAAPLRVASGHHLWTRRGDDPGAFDLPFGLYPDGRAVSVDLQRHHGVAVVGSDRFGSALGATLVTEAATLHGPADLRIVVASTPERLGRWDWTKWLPHCRVGGDPTAEPMLLSDRHDLDEWAAGARPPERGVEVATAPGAPTAPTERRDAAPTPPAAADASADADAGADPTGPGDDDGATGPEGAADADRPAAGDTPADAGVASAGGWSAPRPIETSRHITTLLVLDDISLWSSRDSPLRRLLIDPPPHLRVLALCAGLHEAPGVCSALIEEVPPETVFADAPEPVANPALFGSLATMHLRVGALPETLADLRPALMTQQTALDIARAIAPLDDLDVRRDLDEPISHAPPSLAELTDLQIAGPTPADAVTSTIGIVDAIGRSSGPRVRQPVSADLSAARVTLVSAPDRTVHDGMVAAIVLGAAASKRTDQLRVLTAGPNRPAWHAELPHIGGHVDPATADDPERLVHRVAHVLQSEPDLHVLVVIEDAFDPTGQIDGGVLTGPADPSGLVAGMIEFAATLPRADVVLTTQLPLDRLAPATIERCGLVIDLPAQHAHPGPPRGTMSGDGESVDFLPPTSVRALSPVAAFPGATIDRNDVLTLEPLVFGRSMTPLERRVGRLNSATGDPRLHDSDEALARRLGSSGEHADGRDDLLPPPLAGEVALRTLLAANTGDAVPIGLIDRPERAASDAYRWRPGADGSLLAIGSPRSGMTRIVDILAVGIAARISADDLHVYSIEPLPQRRRALDALPHSAGSVSTDDPAAVVRVILTVAELMRARQNSFEHAEPDVLLVVGDLARMRRRLPDDSVDDTLEALADIADRGNLLGVNVVCVTSRFDDLGPLVRLSGDRLVGSVSDPADRGRLGVPDLGIADRLAGRCWSVDQDRRVQLATPPDSVELEVAAISPPDAVRRPPPLVEGGGR